MGEATLCVVATDGDRSDRRAANRECSGNDFRPNHSTRLTLDERWHSNAEDLTWIRAAIRGDSAAYERFYDKHRATILRICQSVLHDREDSLEATQEVFIKALRALPRYRPTATVFSWIYRIAINHSIDVLRRRRVRKEQYYDEQHTVGAEPRRVGERFEAAESALERREVAARIALALTRLTPDQREVFELFSFAGLDYAEIARRVGIPIGTVMSRLFYARKRLKAQLPNEWDPGGPRRRECARQSVVP